LENLLSPSRRASLPARWPKPAQLFSPRPRFSLRPSVASAAHTHAAPHLLLLRADAPSDHAQALCAAWRPHAGDAGQVAPGSPHARSLSPVRAPHLPHSSILFAPPHSSSSRTTLLRHRPRHARRRRTFRPPHYTSGASIFTMAMFLPRAASTRTRSPW
jgi:hypothetical protein